MVADVIIYTTLYCPFCVNAKNLLTQRGVSYKEIRVDLDHDAMKEMLDKSNGKRTVPQIFINKTHVGGYDDLASLSLEQFNQLMSS